MKILDQNELATAFYDEKNKIIVFKTSNVLANKNIDKIDALLRKAISASEKIAVTGEIVDLTGLRGNFNAIIPFLTKEYYPAVAETGMKKAAYIVSTDQLSRSLVEKIANETTSVEVKAFTDFKEAEMWVVS